MTTPAFRLISSGLFPKSSIPPSSPHLPSLAFPDQPTLSHILLPSKPMFSSHLSKKPLLVMHPDFTMRYQAVINSLGMDKVDVWMDPQGMELLNMMKDQGDGKAIGFSKELKKLRLMGPKSNLLSHRTVSIT